MLTELTQTIQQLNYNNYITISPQLLHEKLWNGLNLLRNAPNKNELLADWTYKSEFMATEERHTNEDTQFTLTKWEESYVYFFWMCIYH